mmetsp:Transcript_22090/g.59585  ORF Transcript_22090/g.59585 Transcript_22090/m.59585 type:complete len:191 (+) Transcript_22090:236-808(+)
MRELIFSKERMARYKAVSGIRAATHDCFLNWCSTVAEGRSSKRVKLVEFSHHKPMYMFPLASAAVRTRFIKGRSEEEGTTVSQSADGRAATVDAVMAMLSAIMYPKEHGLFDDNIGGKPDVEIVIVFMDAGSCHGIFMTNCGVISAKSFHSGSPICFRPLFQMFPPDKHDHLCSKLADEEDPLIRRYGLV